VPNQLGGAGMATGAIAGNVSLNPLGSIVAKGPGDGAVSFDCTWMPGQADHTVLPVTHTFF